MTISEHFFTSPQLENSKIYEREKDMLQKELNELKTKHYEEIKKKDKKIEVMVFC